MVMKKAENPKLFTKQYMRPDQGQLAAADCQGLKLWRLVWIASPVDTLKFPNLH